MTDAQPATPRVFLLFDIDLTLMRSDGAGGAAMARAFELASGLPDAIAGIEFAGRTDRWIAREAARRAGLPADRLLGHYEAHYLDALRRELAARDPQPLPGVVPLLEALSACDRVVLGLATGNQRAGARIKLEAVGLAGYFRHGGFGDHHEQRPDVLREAMTDVGWSPGARLVVIGDSEHDIAAALAVGAVAVGVATGRRSAAQLAAAGAHEVLPDLADLDRTLTALVPRRAA